MSHLGKVPFVHCLNVHEMLKQIMTNDITLHRLVQYSRYIRTQTHTHMQY